MTIPRMASQLSAKNTSHSPPVCRCAIHSARKRMEYNTMQTTILLITSINMRCKFHLRGCSLSKVTKRTDTQMLHANMPYVYKPKEAVTDYAFTTENTVMKAKQTDEIATMQTMEDTYTLYGTYEPTTATAQDPFYYVNTSGSLSLGNNGTVTVGAFRWIMRVESKFGKSSNAAYTRTISFFDGENDETTDIKNAQWSMVDGQSGIWYTLDGRKLDGKPSRAGVYIYNGKKVVIK